MAGHVINLATKYEDLIPIRSWVMSCNASRWLPLKMRMRPLRMRRITWSVSKGSKTITYLESPTPICLFTIHFYWATTTTKGRLLSNRPMLKPFSGEKNSVPSKWGPKTAVLGENGVETLDFGFATPKRHFLRGTASFDVFCVKIGARVSAVAFLKTPQKSSRVTLCRGARNHACAEPKPLNRFG